MDPISTLTIAPAISGGSLAQAPTAPAGAGQAERFLELLQSGGPAADPAAKGVTIDAGALPAVGGQSVGDSILNGMRSLSNEFRSTWGNAQQMLTEKGAEMTLSDMLRMQMQLVQLSFQYELVGKSISRSTQNIESLVKIQ